MRLTPSNLAVHPQTTQISVVVDGTTYGVTDLCIPGRNRPCLVTSVLEFWDFNCDTIRAQTDVQIQNTVFASNRTPISNTPIQQVIGRLNAEEQTGGAALTNLFFKDDSRQK